MAVSVDVEERGDPTAAEWLRSATDDGVERLSRSGIGRELIRLDPVPRRPPIEQ